MEGNGNNVTWRELNLALEPIHRDVKDLKAMVGTLVREKNEAEGARKYRVWLTGTVVAVLSAGWWLPNVLHHYWR